MGVSCPLPQSLQNPLLLMQINVSPSVSVSFSLFLRDAIFSQKRGGEMLRKRGRPAQKEQTMGDSFFNLPGLFVGYGKNSGDSDSARSPISPLDFKVFSGVGSHFCRSPRSPGRSRKSWDSDRVGLGLIDSLSDRSSQMKLRIISVSNPKLFDFSASSPRSLPKNYVISSHDWEKNQTQNENQRQCSGSFSAGNIEQSEDYTCIISHGPNPKMTRIFGDCVLESDEDLGSLEKQDEVGVFSWMLDCAEDPELIPLPSENFLSVCYSCKKKLDGEDIYMYRGEKAFCSSSCRTREIMVEESTKVSEREDE